MDWLRFSNPSRPSSKVFELFEPLFRAHDEFIRRHITQAAEAERDALLRQYPTETSSKYGYGDTIERRIWFDALLDQYGDLIRKRPDDEKVLESAGRGRCRRPARSGSWSCRRGGGQGNVRWVEF